GWRKAFKKRPLTIPSPHLMARGNYLMRNLFRASAERVHFAVDHDGNRSFRFVTRDGGAFFAEGGFDHEVAAGIAHGSNENGSVAAAFVKLDGTAKPSCGELDRPLPAIIDDGELFCAYVIAYRA